MLLSVLYSQRGYILVSNRTTLLNLQTSLHLYFFKRFLVCGWAGALHSHLVVLLYVVKPWGGRVEWLGFISHWRVSLSVTTTLPYHDVVVLVYFELSQELVVILSSFWVCGIRLESVSG